ncbi:MAG: tRNA (N(6)-L-threonylcarbamoyladenosine(37)-C(2))-methylthiotransferase MtaB [Anaerolineae bacterium]|nr:MAG: tRNA (N(6)-L-threonylcarbamoyladenosine(37)-C(2))-methylthiotransferase MtaB [Anaerolineae bacterium]
MAKMKVYLASVGCKLNQSEIETLACRFIAAGHCVVPAPEEADVCVFNSCVVTHVAARKSRQAVRRLRRCNPAARVVVTGCYAQVAPDDLEADVTVSNADKEQLVETLLGEGAIAPVPPFSLSPLSLPYRRTRAFVKIQDGCDNGCTYCITRVARGPQRSRPRADVLAEVQARVEAGYQEVVLTGVHLGGYGHDHGQPPRDSLWQLVTAILSQTDVRRLRLSSVEPWDVTPDVFELWQDPRLCRHLHLPLQSGSDDVLRRMGRRYTVAEFARLVMAARAAIPDVAITTDLIIGFPGETEAHFSESLASVQSIRFARAHVFPYSVRPGTPAALLPDHVSSSEKRARAARMRALTTWSARKFRGRFIGRTVGVLWESRSNGQWRGLTDNYLRVATRSDADLAQTITSVHLDAVTDDGLYGVVV